MPLNECVVDSMLINYFLRAGVNYAMRYLYQAGLPVFDGHWTAGLNLALEWDWSWVGLSLSFVFSAVCGIWCKRVGPIYAIFCSLSADMGFFVILGCPGQGGSQGGLLQSVERFHTILCSTWPTYSTYVHLLRTDEQVLQTLLDELEKLSLFSIHFFLHWKAGLDVYIFFYWITDLNHS